MSYFHTYTLIVVLLGEYEIKYNILFLVKNQSSCILLKLTFHLDSSSFNLTRKIASQHLNMFC